MYCAPALGQLRLVPEAPQHAAADGAGVLGRLDVHGAVPYVKHLVGVQAERADHLVDPGGVRA